MRELRKYRKNEKEDSISEHGGTDDEEYVAVGGNKAKRAQSRRKNSSTKGVRRSQREKKGKTVAKDRINEEEPIENIKVELPINLKEI